MKLTIGKVNENRNTEKAPWPEAKYLINKVYILPSTSQNK